eukprot:TRINITY_DN512_c0_g1_i3.p2 TRINITY_DN512_c0_g1~~TRINITY_DN512_c0_g1_i3.p2  ORF type:complete len:107 (-),score=17.18 TRINITY_DN512_c0_g1_i3:88-408(-)
MYLEQDGKRVYTSPYAARFPLHIAFIYVPINSAGNQGNLGDVMLVNKSRTLFDDPNAIPVKNKDCHGVERLNNGTKFDTVYPLSLSPSPPLLLSNALTHSPSHKTA